MEEIIDYTEILLSIKQILASLCVYSWGLLAWNIVAHIRNRREARKGRE